MKAKHFITLLLAATMLFVSCSCNGNNINNTETKKEISIAEITENILSECTFPDMYALTKEELEGEYGVDAALITDFYAAVPTEYPGIERIFIATTANASDTGTVIAELFATFETVKAEYKDYLPDEYTKTRNAKIISDDNFVSLIICENADTANDIIKNHIR